MGKLYSYTYISLDGVVEAPDAWVAPFFSEELGADLAGRLSSAEAMVLGSRTYREFAGFWPQQGDHVPFATLNNGIRKLAVSGTLRDAEWHNTRVVRDEEIDEIKAGAAADLHITGSAALVRDWLERGVLDELVLVVCPVVVGRGRRLFDGVGPADLAIAGVRRFPRGVLALTYAPA